MERPSVEVLRESARQAADASSLRLVAGQVGMSARGLLKFLDGSLPRRQTLLKLRDWYVRHAVREGGISEDTALAALAALTEGIPPRMVVRAVGNLIATARENYHDAGADQPAWIQRVLE
jgi:hypothetical protein